MFAFLIVVLFGILFSFFATQNTQGVAVQLLQYNFGNVPLYLVSLISLLAGVAVSWLISLLDWASNTMALRGRDMHIRKTEKVIQHLQEHVHELEAKNAELYREKEEVQEDAREEVADIKDQAHRPSFFDRFRHKPAL